MAFAHFVAGRYAEALSCAEASMRDRPDFLLPNLIAASAAGLSGRHADAQGALARARWIDPSLRLSNLDRVQAMRSEEFICWSEGLRKAGLSE
jgi:adenylate cyclase